MSDSPITMYKVTAWGLVGAMLVVHWNDDGKTGTVPAQSIGALIAGSTTSATNALSGAQLAVINSVTGADYSTRAGYKLPTWTLD